MFSVWPLFLFFSQKVLIPLKVFELSGTKIKKSVSYLFLYGLLLWIVLTFNLLMFYSNTYATKHYLSFSFFLFFMVFLGYETKKPERKLFNLNLITGINFIVLLVAIALYYNNVDLSSYRGLNFISGSDDVIQRMFIETSSLLVISNFKSSSRKFNILLICLTLFYIVVLNKSIFLITLLLYQIILQYNLDKYRKVLIVFLIIPISTIFIFPDLILGLRGDLFLSLTFKLNQIVGIVENIDMTNIFFGHGLGYFLPEFATDKLQPYQIESQLSMLLLQIGIFGMFFYISFVYIYFKTVVPKNKFKAFGMYLIIGLINPWLFLPTWLITTSYFFRNKSYV